MKTVTTKSVLPYILHVLCAGHPVGEEVQCHSAIHAGEDVVLLVACLLAQTVRWSAVHKCDSLLTSVCLWLQYN